jgi:hypothetical protein
MKTTLHGGDLVALGGLLAALWRPGYLGRARSKSVGNNTSDRAVALVVHEGHGGRFRRQGRSGASSRQLGLHAPYAVSGCGLPSSRGTTPVAANPRA